MHASTLGGELVIELKAVELIAPVHLAQVLSYLKATGHHLALLINFNVNELRRGIKRVVRSPSLSTGVLGGVAVPSSDLFDNHAR